MRRSLFTIPFGLIVFSSCRAPAPPPREGAQEARLETVEVRPSVQPPWVFELAAVFDEIELVEALEGDLGRVLERSEWSFDKVECRVLVRRSGLAEDTSIRVHGRRRVPWAWHLREFDPDSVQIVLGDREGVRGRDFEIDEQRGVLALASAEWSDPSRDFYVTYSLPADPRHPESRAGVAFGNHRDTEVVRRVLGLPPSGPAAAEPGTLVGQNAVPTQDPVVFRLARTQPAQGLRVGIAHSNGGVDEWLEPGSFLYDEARGELRLLARTVDPDTETVIVLGAMPSGRVIRLGKPVAAGEAVKIVLEGKLLAEGSEFEVDRERGEITVFVPAFQQRGARYLVVAGNTMLGNMPVDEHTRSLLGQ